MGLQVGILSERELAPSPLIVHRRKGCPAHQTYPEVIQAEVQRQLDGIVSRL